MPLKQTHNYQSQPLTRALGMSESLHEQFCLIRNRRARYVVAAAFLWFLLWHISELGNQRFGSARYADPLQSFSSWLPKLVIWSVYAWMAFAVVRAGVLIIRECELRDERIAYGAMSGFFATSFVLLITHNNLANHVLWNIQLVTLAIGTLASWRLVFLNPASAEEKPVSRRSFGLSAQIGIYLALVVAATFGCALVASALLHLLGSLVRLTGAESLANQLVSIPTLPFSPLQTVIGWIFGFVATTFYRTRSALWVWVGPLFIFAIAALTFRQPSVFQNSWSSFASHYFGQCRFEDCVDRLFVVAPLLSSAAFAAGALVRMKIEDSRVRQIPV
jgi:hypothetical protein